MKQKSIREQERPYSSDRPDIGIAKRSRLFFILSATTIYIASVIYLLGIAFAENSREASTFERSAQRKAIDHLREEVSSVLGQLMTVFPKDARLSFLAVKFHQGCRSPKKVMEILKKGLVFNPESYDLNLTAFEVSINTGDYENAISYGNKAIAINPNDRKLHDDLAEAFISFADYSQAIELLKKKTKSFGPSVRSLWLLGQAHILAQDYEKARDYYEMALKKGPKTDLGERYSRYNIYRALGKVYMKLKQTDKAKEYMEINRKFMEEVRRKRLGETKKRKSDILYDTSGSEIFVSSKTLSQLCLQGIKLYNAQEQQEDAQRLFDNAQLIFNRLIENLPDNADVHREFAFMYLSTGQKLVYALELAEKAAKLNQKAMNYHILGYLYEENKDMANAVSAFEKAFKLEPTNPVYKRNYERMKKEHNR